MNDDHVDFSTVRLVLAVLFAFNAIAIGIVFVVSRSSEASPFAAVVAWPWLILGLVFASGGLAFRWRLRRVRARRHDLLRSEWMIDRELDET